MDKAQVTNYPSLASEHIGHGRKHYFIDIKKAANNSHFLLITSSEQFRGDEKYYRQTVRLWEEDLAMFVEGLSMVLRRLAHYDLPSPEPVMKVLKAAEGMQVVALEDRPREKLHAFGAGTLSNTELLGILLCTGSSEMCVLDLCGQIMGTLEDDAVRLRFLNTEALCGFRGVGAAKAATLPAALELGRRAFFSAKY